METSKTHLPAYASSGTPAAASTGPLKGLASQISFSGAPQGVPAPVSDQFSAQAITEHASTQNAVSFPNKTSVSGTPQELTQNLDQILKEHAQVRDELKKGNVSPQEKQSLQTRLAELETAYKETVLANPDALNAKPILQLGIEAYLGDLNQLSPEMAAAAQAAAKGEPLPSLNLQQQDNFPLALMLAETHPEKLTALNHALNDVKAGKDLSPEKLQTLKSFGFELKEGKLFNALTKEAVSAASLPRLVTLSASVADGAGLQGEFGLPGFKALGEVSGKLATALGAVEELRQQRQQLDGLVTDLEVSRQDLHQAEGVVQGLQLEQATVTDEIRSEEENLEIVEEVAAAQQPGQSELVVPPGRQAAWTAMLASADVQVSQSGGHTVYRYHGQVLDSPDSIVGMMRQRFRNRLGRMRERLQNLGERLGQARDTLAQAIQRTTDLQLQIGRQRERVQSVLALATSSVRELGDIRRNPAIWNQLPPDLRSQFDASFQQVSRDFESEAQAARQSDQRAVQQVRQADQDLSHARNTLDLANQLLKQNQDLKLKLAAHAEGKPAEQQPLSLKETLLQIQQKLPKSAPPGKDQEFKQLQDFLANLSKEISTAQSQQGQSQKLESSFTEGLSQRLRSELTHHQQLLESFDSHRREQIQALLAALQAT